MVYNGVLGYFITVAIKYACFRHTEASVGLSSKHRSEQAPQFSNSRLEFDSVILATDSCEKSQSTLC